MTSVPETLTAIEIPCCLCGTMILPNAANQCGACLAQEFDLKSTLQRGPGGADDILIHQCRECRLYERTPGKPFEYFEQESPELLALCLKKIPALASHATPKLHLVDAMWVWTEPHSMRLKVRLTVRTEVQNVTIQQRVMVELVVRFKQCPSCNREYTNRTWHALVQVRQKRNDDAPRKGLVVMEMAIARSGHIRKNVLRVDTCRQGFDFYFLSLVHAQTFAHYLARIAPMRIKTTKKLVSTDVKSNTANLRHTVACDMVPLCRDDLVMVHKSAKGSLSGRLCLVIKMSSVVHLVDANPKRSGDARSSMAELAPETYYKGGGEKIYKTVSSSRRMIRFVVLDVELCQDHDYASQHDLYEGPSSGVDKYALADVEVARESDMGQNDDSFRCVTHLGNLLQVGDVVLGYDLVASVLSGGSEWAMDNCFNSSFIMPDVVLVKKVQGVGAKELEVEKNEGPKQHAKSSVSKKRERRRRKEEKKMLELEQAAARMGLLEDAEDASLDEKGFEEELAKDPELAKELNEATKELATAVKTRDTGDEMVLTVSDQSTGEEQVAPTVGSSLQENEHIPKNTE